MIPWAEWLVNASTYVSHLEMMCSLQRRADQEVIQVTFTGKDKIESHLKTEDAVLGFPEDWVHTSKI